MSQVSIYKLFKEYDDPHKVGESLYLKMNYAVIKKIVEKVFTGHDVLFPANMGALSIKGSEIKKAYFNKGGHPTRFYPDWKATKDLWASDPEAKKEKKIIYHLNEHTSGIRFKWFWSKKRILFFQKEFYWFVPSRANKRELAKRIKAGSDYFLNIYKRKWRRR